ncbi:hypothetical protein FB451DRAFT_1397033 [Mycena latifolia]|nr:hypothetical protein FB451DRAFT_1397033 [Mycena latifolia]
MATRTTRSNKNAILEGELQPTKARPRPKTKAPARRDPAAQSSAAEAARAGASKRTRSRVKPSQNQPTQSPKQHDALPRASVLPPASPPRPRPRPVHETRRTGTGGLPDDNLATDPFNLGSCFHNRRRAEEEDLAEFQDVETRAYIEIDDNQDYDFPPPVKEEEPDIELDVFDDFAYHTSSPPPRRHSTDARSRTDSPPRHTPGFQSRPHSADARSDAARAHSRPRRRSPTPRQSPLRTPSHSRSRTIRSPSDVHPSGSAARPFRATPPSRTESEARLLQTPRLPPRHGSMSLPPSSPPVPREESPDSASDNDYAKQRAEKQRTLAKRAELGYRDPPGSEEEDEADLIDFEEDVEANGLEEEEPAKRKPKPKGSTRPRRGTTKKTQPNAKGRAQEKQAKEKGKAKGKGKEKAREREEGAVEGSGGEPGPNEDSDSDSSDNNSDNNSDTRHKSGPIPAAIQECLTSAYDTFLAEVDALAHECGKTPNTLHQIVGSKVKGVRKSSTWNIWQSYHAEKHPKPSDMEMPEYNRLARRRFKEATGLTGHDLNDLDAVYQAFPELQTWHDNLMANATAHWRDKGKFKYKVTKAMEPRQARLVSQTMGVHVWGYVIDVQAQASTMWGSTGDFKTMCTQYESSLCEGMKEYEHVLGTIAMQRRAADAGQPLVGLLLPQALAAKDGEGARDSRRRVFAKIMSTQLVAALTATGNPPTDPAKTKMVWGPKFLDLAFTNQFKIINYPTILEGCSWIIGGSFELKKIGLAQYKEFMPALEKTSQSRDGDEGMQIVPWDDEEKDLSDDAQREIALVSTADGKTLQAVRDSAAYNASIAKARLPKATKSKGHGSRSHRSPSRARSPPPVPAQSRRQRLSRSPSRHADSSHHQPDYQSLRHACEDDHMPPPPRGYMPPPSEYIHYKTHKASPPPRAWENDYPRWPVPALPCPRAPSSRHAYDQHPPSPPPPTYLQRPPSPPRARSSRHGYPQRPLSPPPRAGSSRDGYLQRPPSPSLSGTSEREHQGHAARPRQVSRSQVELQLEERPPKRQRTQEPRSRVASQSGALEAQGGLERPAKHKRVSDSVAPKKALYKCRFNVPNAVTKVFYATDFTPVAVPTRADRYTLVAQTENGYRVLEKGYTPVLASEEDHGRYQSEVQLHGLFGV